MGKEEDEAIARMAESVGGPEQGDADPTIGLEDSPSVSAEKITFRPGLQVRKAEAKTADEKRKRNILADLKKIGGDFKKDFDLKKDKEAIKSLARKVASPVKEAWRKSTSEFDLAKDKELFKSLPGKAKGAVREKWRSLKSKFKDLLKE